MDQLFFHVHECGTATCDEEGRDTVSAVVMRDIAIEAAREVMYSEVKEGRLCLSCHIEVVNERGTVYLLLSFEEPSRSPD